MDWATLCIAFAASALITHVLPSVPVRRVWNYIFITARTYFVPTSLRGHHYLSAAQGWTTHLSVTRRRTLWRQALFYIARILRLRKRWSALGRHLQAPRIQDLVSGVTRKYGILSRIHSADSVSVPLAKAKARAQIRQRFAASSSASR
jgi:hypothetical protein